MKPPQGLSCPVIVPDEIDWEFDYSTTKIGHLLELSPVELAAVDPLAMNLIVAKGIASLSDIDISHYQKIVNEWVADFQTRCLPQWEPFYHETPEEWGNDIRFFRLGAVCQYLAQEVAIEYNRHQREDEGILYTNPSDLFLNGIIDTLEGTCGNMSALHLAFGWRLGWPVSLACAKCHFVLRFDDGETTYNIESTSTRADGFKSDPDEYLVETHKLPPVALSCGSDIRALRPHELLGAFVGLRARHIQDFGRNAGDEELIMKAEREWLLARYLFPTNRVFYTNHLSLTCIRGESLFQPGEAGHPDKFSHCLGAIDFHRAHRWQLDDWQSKKSDPPPRRSTLFDSLFLKENL